MLKKLLWWFVCFSMFPCSLVVADGILVQEKFLPTDPKQTIIGNSTNASSWYYLSGSVSPQKNIYGDEEPIKAFQWFDYYNTYDILFSYTNSPTAKGVSYGIWHSEWGPYQNQIESPRKGTWDLISREGVWVCLAASESNTTVVVFESK